MIRATKNTQLFYFFSPFPSLTTYLLKRTPLKINPTAKRAEETTNNVIPPSIKYFLIVIPIKNSNNKGTKNAVIINNPIIFFDIIITPIHEICKDLIIDERAAYELISRLRKKGIPICAKRNGLAADRGYYIATSEQEWTDELAPYKSQVHEMMIIIRQIEGADIDQWPSEGERIR